MTNNPQAGGPARGGSPPPQKTLAARHARRAAAIVVLAALSVPMFPQQVSANVRKAVSDRFHIERLAMPEVGNGPYATERVVHPTLTRFVGWMSAVGAAVAINDMDGDGLPNDICHVDPRTDTVVIAPAPGTAARYAPFILEPAPLVVNSTMKPFGCVPGDFNEDGQTDVIVYYNGRTPIVFFRSGEEYLPAELVPDHKDERWYTSAMTVADLDGDGHNDLYVANYFQDGSRLFDTSPEFADERQVMQQSFSRAFNGGETHILLWKEATGSSAPSARFEEVKGVISEDVSRGWSLAVGAQDLDGDGLPEIFVANDFGPDRLLYNKSTPGHLDFALVEGGRGFDTVHSKVLGRDSFKGMGVDFADLNGDTVPDIMVSNIGADYSLLEHHNVWVSTGETEPIKNGVAPYEDLGDPLGLARNSWAWDLKFVDLDNDGNVEVLQALGFLKGEINRWPELQELGTAQDELVSYTVSWPVLEAGDDVSGHVTMPIMTRIGDKYVDIAADLGLDQEQVSRGIATADVDGDGDMDYAVANQWEPSFYYQNQCEESGGCGQYLGLNLRLPVRLDPAAHELSSEEGEPAADAGSDGTVVEEPAADSGAEAVQPKSDPTVTQVFAGLPTRDGAGETAIVGASRPAIGASVTVRLPDGRVLASQVDGGNGHVGRRSPDIHFGLGQLPADQALPVEVKYRDPDGQLHTENLTIEPGWHTVVLAWPTADGSPR